MQATRSWVGFHTLPRYRACLFMVAVLLGAIPARPARSQEALKEEELARPTKREPIYDEQADAKAQIGAALTKAKRHNTRVLIMFGGNWCGWCYKLHDVFTK